MLEQRESLFLHSVVNVGKVNSAKCSYPCKIDGCMRRALLSRICDVHSVELTHPSIFLSFPLHCCDSRSRVQCDFDIPRCVGQMSSSARLVVGGAAVWLRDTLLQTLVAEAWQEWAGSLGRWAGQHV